ncbi:arginase [Psychromonas marina]|uniref:Arginase n=1 Tax=Psychromonas marina TaxID=88364 RepID=A0ABQ6E3S6_9GAMM|nr:arginase [Psychromonas marina]GLS92039.1 arginase [Psychromonas marina]
MTFNKCIIVECDLGGFKKGASQGGDAVVLQLKNKPELLNVIKTPNCILRKSNTPQSHYLDEINQCLDSLSRDVSDFLQENVEDKLIVFSGDHSTACGTLAGVKNAYPNKRIGAIWIDAHGDIHSPYTSDSGNMHGMPVAAAMGLDHKEIAVNKLDNVTNSLWENTKSICNQAIQPADFVYIGIRDLDKVEWDIIELHDIKYYSVEEVKVVGGAGIAQQTLDHLSLCDFIYISFDIDSLDSSLVPGTGMPADNGLSLDCVKSIFDTLLRSKKIKALEVVEVNPLLDTNNKTTKTIASLLDDFM